MTAFDTAWSLLKAEQEFITGGETPEQIARKRLWLYNEPEELRRLDEEPDVIPRWNDKNRENWDHEIIPLSGKTNREELVDKYGDFHSIGQANTDYGYEQKRSWGGREEDDRTKPIYGEGRTLLNLPEMWDSTQYNAGKAWKKANPAPLDWMRAEQHDDWVEAPKVDWKSDDYQTALNAERDAHSRNERLRNRLRRQGRAHSDRRDDYLNDPENMDEDLIDEIIRLTNHEVGHTTQPEEEDAWKNIYTSGPKGKGRFNVKDRARGESWDEQYNDNISGIMRDILMQESLATLFERPHQTPDRHKQAVAEYNAHDLHNRHDMTREVSHGMADFFRRKPEHYRDPKVVADDREWWRNFRREQSE